MGNTWVTAGNTVTKLRRRPKVSGIDIERAYMNDYWSFRKKYYEVQDSDEYWTAVIRESDALIRKHDCDDYLKALVLVCVDDLERRYRQEFPKRNIYKPGEVATTVYNRIMNKHKKEGAAS